MSLLSKPFERNTTVRIQLLRRIAVKAGLISASLLIAATLTSCGGGGTSASTIASGPLLVIPASAELFPGVPVTFTVSGGTPGYVLASSNTTVLPLGSVQVSGNSFTLVANDVAVDTDVTITVRDTTNATISTTAHVRVAVLNNQTTLTPLAPLAPGCGTNTVCTGGDANVTVTALRNGIKLVNRPILYTVIQGQFQFVTPNSLSLVNSITINTDENGLATVKLAVARDVPTQVATLTTTDTTSGLVRYFNFNIVQQTNGVGILSSLPSGNTTFTGPDGLVGGFSPGTADGQCPIGDVDYYIFGGTPPYRIASPLPSLVLVAAPGLPFAAETTLTINGGHIVARIFGCGQTQLIVTDATNRTIETSQVIGVKGKDATVTPPTPTPTLTVSPNTGCISDTGGTNSLTVTVTGGTATKNLTTTSTKVTISPSSGTGTFTSTLTAAGTASPASGEAVVVNVSDGTTTVPVNVTRKATCP